MEAPLIKSLTVQTPAGLQSSMSQARVITQMSGLTVTGMTDTVIVNGRRTLREYDGNLRRFMNTSPEGRTSFTFFDSQGRVVRDSIPGISAATYIYDSRGFLTEISQGGRITRFTYNAQGFRESMTDPLLRTDSSFYDLVGRVTREVFQDGREIRYSYDVNGNLTSLTPPGRSQHEFDYNSVDLIQRYTPPLLNGDTTAARYVYDLDQRIRNTIRPDSIVVSVFYDALGCGACGSVSRPKTIIVDRGTLNFAYNSTTGLLDALSGSGGNTITYVVARP